MRKVIIGRGHDCDIVVDDVTDVVSRRQAIITFTIWGRMTIYDLSTNGTYVNGIIVPKPSGYPLKRTDKVNFGSVCEFDLCKVKDPYRKMKITIGVIIVVIAAAVAAFITFHHRSADTISQEHPRESSVGNIIEEVEAVSDSSMGTFTEQPDMISSPAVAEKKEGARKVSIKKETKKGNADKTSTYEPGSDTIIVNDYSKEKDSDELNGKY